MTTLPKDFGALPDWDQAALLERVMDDEPLAEIIAAEFLESVPLDLARMRAAMEANDDETLLKHVHRINGASGNVGAIRLHAIAYDTEAALHNHTELDLAARMTMLEEAFAAFLKAFAAWREARPQT